ncbi:hypothetical protein CFSAN002368_12823 [Clostridium botulinum A1 str. CFSAN002368]|nr:hypothetical protein CFSAN002368_12823 [Clostridium botulinum A1 str. CFSAN002368]
MSLGVNKIGICLLAAIGAIPNASANPRPFVTTTPFLTPISFAIFKLVLYLSSPYILLTFIPRFFSSVTISSEIEPGPPTIITSLVSNFLTDP